MKLVCLGDSLTAGYGVRSDRCWVSLAAGESGWEMDNEGLSGDTTGGMLARLQGRLLPAWSAGPAPRPDAVLVMGGTNDVLYAGTDLGARADLGALLQALSAGGLRPLAGLPLPVCPDLVPLSWRGLTDYGRAAALLEEYCAWLRLFCRSLSLPLVDFRSDFLTPGGAVRAELLLDGIHPTEAGHALMARRLCAALRQGQGGWA